MSFAQVEVSFRAPCVRTSCDDDIGPALHGVDKVAETADGALEIYRTTKACFVNGIQQHPPCFAGSDPSFKLLVSSDFKCDVEVVRDQFETKKKRRFSFLPQTLGNPADLLRLARTCFR
jgi:hypothetical protein